MISKQTAAYERKVVQAMDLLHRKGFDTQFMDSTFKALGASMQERQGTVEGWLRSMRSIEISNVLARLRAL